MISVTVLVEDFAWYSLQYIIQLLTLHTTIKTLRTGTGSMSKLKQECDHAIAAFSKSHEAETTAKNILKTIQNPCCD